MSDSLELGFWAATERGPVRVLISDQSAVCFIARAATASPPELGVPGYRRRAVDLATLQGDPVDALYFAKQRQLQQAREALRSRDIRLYESDVNPADRFLMERFITASFEIRGEASDRCGFLEFRNPSLRRSDYRPTLRYLSLDIETEGLEGALYSIAGSGPDGSRVFMVGEAAPTPGNLALSYHRDETALLLAFFDWLQAVDPDVLLGWNVIEFDLQFLERKCRSLGIRFAVGRGAESATILPARGGGSLPVARIPGRVVLDGIESLRAAFWVFESYALDEVSRILLGRGKNLDKTADRVAEIQRLYREDKPELAAYNLEDCRLVIDIFERTKLIDFVIERASLTGLAMDRHRGSAAAFDNLYLPRLHRKGRVAPNMSDVPPGPDSPGGYVMDSKPGLYGNVLVLDFKSLYPSIIRTFMIDPWGLAVPGEDPVPGFADGRFAREGAVLPDLIGALWQAREQAKRDKNDPLSQAVKIIMNSFYGVLGSTGCRFHDQRLASSITRRGHLILQNTRDFIEESGLTVIYGDTDSLFVLLDSKLDRDASLLVGNKLAKEINGWWQQKITREYRLKSYLEIEFETHFERFLMPTVRGSRTGSKKRYAGLVRHDDGSYDLVFKGLESVRTDWTPLARRVQRELYRRIFLHESYDDYLRDNLRDLYAGRLDHELVYRKRLRRPLDAYKTNVPPHVQAARKLDHAGKTVSYVMTRHGPEPVKEGAPAPDHEHYRERQLAPAADGILHFVGTSFDEVTGAQLAFF